MIAVGAITARVNLAPFERSRIVSATVNLRKSIAEMLASCLPEEKRAIIRLELATPLSRSQCAVVRSSIDRK